MRRQLRNGEKAPLTEADRWDIEEANESMAGKAYRVLGLALASGNGVRELAEPRDLVWLGLIGMADPIREGVAQAIRALHQAGVRTVMITGDQSPTAYAIGQELQLSRAEPLEILDATHLGEMDHRGAAGPVPEGPCLCPGEPGPQADDRPGLAAVRPGSSHDRRRHQ